MTLVDSFEEEGYAPLRMLVSPDMCELIVRASYKSELIYDQSPCENMESATLRNSPHGDSLLEMVGNALSNEIGKVMPTYSFFRAYSKGAVLDMHQDRDECEISVSLALSQNDWSFNLLDKRHDKQKINLNMGDGILYKGCEIPHGRIDPLCEDQSHHIFLHFVR